MLKFVCGVTINPGSNASVILPAKFLFALIVKFILYFAVGNILVWLNLATSNSTLDLTSKLEDTSGRNSVAGIAALAFIE